MEQQLCPRRSGHVAFAVGENLYVWGGFQTSTDADTATELPASDLWTYNADGDFWTRRKCTGQCPSTTSGASGVLILPHFYLVGGWTRSGYVEHVHRLHVTSLAWERVKTSGPGLSPRWNFTAWAHDSRLICFGGYGTDFRSKWLSDHGDFVMSKKATAKKEGWNNQLLMLDVSTNQWTNPPCKGTPPSPRSGHAGAVWGDTLYVSGGACSNTLFADLHCLHLDTNTWSGLLTGPGQVPRERCWHSVTAVAQDRLLLFGGLSENDQPLDDVWLLTPSAARQRLQCTELRASSGHPRHYHTASCTQAGNVLVFGGCVDNIMSSRDAPRFSEQILEFQMQPKPLEGHPSKCKTVLDLRDELKALKIVLPRAGAAGATQDSSLPRLPSFHDVQKLLPDKWPDREKHNPREEDVKVVTVAEDDLAMRSFFEAASAGTQKSVYRMQQPCRGIFLLINNAAFDFDADRVGTEVDGKALEQLFRQLGFHVRSPGNCTAQKIIEELRAIFSPETDHSDYDCFACAILTHGERGALLGTDGCTVTLDAIIDIVTSSTCRSLVGKPKLFFLQACEGDEPDYGKEVPDGKKGDNSNAAGAGNIGSEEPKPGGDAEDMGCAGDALGVMPEVAGASVTKVLIPAGADIFMAGATTPGFIAVRNTVHGTWFMQALVYVFANFAHMLDLTDLMLAVQNLVSKSQTRGGVMMQPSFRQALNRKLYFFPGLVKPR